MLPLWLFIISLLVAVSVTIWSYASYKSLSLASRSILVILRLTTFTIIFILLLNPGFNKNEIIERVPLVSVMVDNTQSIAIEKGDWSGAESMEKVIDETRIILNNLGTQTQWLGFSRSLEELEAPELLRFNRSGTDIYSSLMHYEQDGRADVLILITDGISTTGRDPSFAGRMMTRPVVSIAVGDTTLQRDLILQRVDYPDQAYINSESSFIATVRNEGFANQQLEVRFTVDGQVHDSQTIQTTGERSTHQVEFLYETSQQGLRNFQIEIVPVEGEWSTQNNMQQFGVEFLDDQIGVLHLAFEIHPDVGALRNLMETNPSLRVTARTWVGGNRFAEGLLPAVSDSIDLVILHGMPVTNEHVTAVQRFTSGIPVLVLLTPTVTTDRLNNVVSGIPGRPEVRFDRGIQGVSLRISSEQTGHPVLNLPPLELNRSPILQSPAAGIVSTSGSTALLYATIRGEPTTTPVLTLNQTGNLRSAFFLAYGFHQWYLQGDQDQRRWMDTFLTNVITWTAADILDDQFEIQTNQSSYDSGEQVVFLATVRNESGNPESQAQISLAVSDAEAQETRNFSFQPSGRGRYEVNIGALSQGNYTYQAEASVGNQLLGTRSGSFQVGESMIELINTQRNDEALQQISTSSGGQFITYDMLEGLEDYLAETLREKTYQELTTPAYLNRSLVWFIILMLILMGEWLFRKKLALP